MNRWEELRKRLLSDPNAVPNMEYGADLLPQSSAANPLPISSPPQVPQASPSRPPRELAGRQAVPRGIDRTATNSLFDQLIAQQEQNAQGLQRQADVYGAQEVQTDFSPLLALVDSWTGSKTQQGYKKPDSAQDRMVNSMTLKKAAGDAQTDITKLQLQKTLGNEKSDVALLARALAGDKADAARSFKVDNAALNYTKSFESDNRELRKQGLSFDQVDQLLSKAEAGNTTATSALGIKMAKAMGEVGVMTENDIKRYIQSKKLSQKAADTLYSWFAGVPTAPTLTEVKEISDAMKDSVNSHMKKKFDTYTNRLAKNFGMSKEEAEARFDVPEEYRAGFAPKEEVEAPAPLSAKDQAAVDWAKKPENAKDARAQKILQIHGIK